MLKTNKENDALLNIGLPHLRDKKDLDNDDLDTIKKQDEYFIRLYKDSYLNNETHIIIQNLLERIV